MSNIARKLVCAIAIAIGDAAAPGHLLASEDRDYGEQREQSYGGEKCSQDYWVHTVWDYDSVNGWYMVSYDAMPLGSPYDCHVIY